MKKIFETNYAELSKELRHERSEGKRIVMCSGTFDLFHIGHMRMLAAAKQMGDILIVVVKSDKAASLKKENPPVLNQVYRMEAIANCISADYVVMADYDTSRNIQFNFDNASSYQWLNMFEPVVKELKPDLFVHEDNPMIKNARKQLFSKYGIEGKIQARTKGISTTEIIDTIKTRVLVHIQENR